MLLVKQMIVGLFIVFHISLSNSLPFFFNHTSFITSLFGASLSPASSALYTTPNDNPYSENIAVVPAKSDKLQKLPQTEDDSVVYPETNTHYDFSTTPTTPIILKKKLNKIIRKLITVAQIKQALHGHLHDNNGFQYPEELDPQDIRISKQYGEPLKIDLTSDLMEGNNDEVLEKMDNSTVTPPNVFVYLLELFGSLIGLSIGAINHINNSLSQNNTI